MIKALFALLVLVGLGVGVYMYMDYVATKKAAEVPATTTPEVVIPVAPVVQVSAIVPGTYEIIPSESGINWSGKKPRIEGYINSGTMPVASGTVEVSDTYVTGMFTLTMSDLTVGLTAKKPGKEGALEEHLKKSDFFDVENFPTGSFEIATVTPRADVATSFMYDIVGNLTLKGITNEITFPAVLQKEGDNMVARAQFEIDRTLWDMKLGSGKFYTELGDNMIDDMVAIDLTIVAKPVVVALDEDTTATTTDATTTSAQDGE